MSASKFSTYDVPQSHIRDVDQTIRNIDPTDTPWQSMSGRGKAKQKLFEWMEEALPASNGDNAQVEGFDAPAASHEEVAFRSNIVQTLSRTAKVTGFVDETDLYGRKKEFARQMRLTSTALKIDLEKALIGTVADGRDSKGARAAVVGADSTARRFATPAAMVDNSMVFDNSGSPRALDEDLLLDVSEALYNVGVKASNLIVKPADTRVIATFANATGRERDMGDRKKVVNSVEVYEGPLQTLKVSKNRHLMPATAWVLDPDMWDLVWFRGWRMKDIPSGGDWKAKFIYGDAAPKHKHYRSSALICDLS